MNYFDHHIGDYDEATAHLTACEDGIYSRLIRKYMATEKPLPADIKTLQRLVRARAKDEKEAVQTILDEFFELREDGWHQHRCDETIARYLDKQRKARASAEARWGAPKSQSDGNANAYPDAMRTHSDAASNSHEKSVTRASASNNNFRANEDLSSEKSMESTAEHMRTHSEGNAHQAPVASSHTPEEEKQRHNHGGQSRAVGDPLERNVAVSVLLRGLGVVPMTGMHPAATEFANTGATDEQLRAAVDIARQRKPAPEAISPNYLRPILAEVMNPQAPRPTASRADARAQERADVHAILSGRKPNHERTPDAIDVEARVIE